MCKVKYRVSHLPVNLGWFDIDLGVPPSSPANQPLLPYCQTELGRQWNTRDWSQQNPDGTPCTILHWCLSDSARLSNVNPNDATLTNIQCSMLHVLDQVSKYPHLYLIGQVNILLRHAVEPSWQLLSCLTTVMSDGPSEMGLIWEGKREHWARTKCYATGFDLEVTDRKVRIKSTKYIVKIYRGQRIAYVLCDKRVLHKTHLGLIWFWSSLNQFQPLINSRSRFFSRVVIVTQTGRIAEERTRNWMHFKILISFYWSSAS